MLSPLSDAHDTLPPATCNLQLTGALPCDAYHHYYHYQSSAQYLLLAEILHALGMQEEMKQALQKALFQDHYNQAALAFKAEGRPAQIAYDKHPLLDSAFCASVAMPQSASTRLHDEAVAAWQGGDGAQATALCEAALRADAQHSNSHYALARSLQAQGQHGKALPHAQEAVRLSHILHDAYHRAASQEHLARARQFLSEEAMELAYNECTKALDLHRQNREAAELSKVLLNQLRSV